ncbi:hypothetical protein H257_17753 [Aphanomyces astaci]|uniref:Uncharacterized protein n=1 Tax=Aphanomyces astaci TaxID=112090 RepID=W4FDL0_APHAT|nr:hypothetical protein H257_17753 [Aphanomyces astaci]ETV65557.1 hypothetical protein H257_17753 [Aphanomyces astaci]|eukprot:XP_009844946.1 hypothetical protein H257_17753 [Aphanomyces astaci]
MDRAQVGVFKETHQVRFRGFLEGQDSRGLEAQVGLVVLRDFTHEALERQLADEEVGGLLVAADFAQGDGTRAVTMGLLHAAGRGHTLAGGLGGQLLAGRLAAGGLACSLLGSGHVG